MSTSMRKRMYGLIRTLSSPNATEEGLAPGLPGANGAKEAAAEEEESFIYLYLTGRLARGAGPEIYFGKTGVDLPRLSLGPLSPRVVAAHSGPDGGLSTVPPVRKRPMAAMANLDEDLALSHDADSVQDLRLAGAVPSPNPSLAHSEHHLDCASHGKRPMAAMANLDEDLALSHDADSVQDLRLAGAVPSPNPSLAHSEHHLDCASHGKRPMAAMANLDEDLALSHDADSVQDLRLAGAVPSPNPSLAHSEHHLDCASHGKRPMAAMANLDEDLALSHDADSVQDLRLAGAVPSPNPSLAHSEHHLDCASHGKRPMAAMANLDEDLALSHDADSVQDLRLAGAVPSPNPSLAHSEHHLDCASHGKRPMAAMANLDEDLALSHDADSVQDLRLAGAVPSPNPSLAHSEHHLDCASHGKRPMAAMANLDEDLALSHDADSVQDLRLAGAVPSPNPSLAHSEHHLDCASHGKRPMAAMANLDEDLALSHDADSVQDLRLAGAVPSPNPSLAHSEHHLDCASHGKRPMAAMANLDEDLALSHDADSVQDLRLAGAVPSPNPSLAHSEHHLDCASHGKRPMAAMANLDEDLALSHDADSVQDLRLAGAVPSPNPSLAHSEHHLDCASHGKRPMAAMANLDEDLALSHDADSVQDLRLAGAVPSPNPSLAHSEHHLDCASHGKRPMAAMANLDEDLALSHDADSVQDLRLAGAVPSPNPSLAHSEHHLDCASHGKRPMAAMANLDEDLALSHDADSVQDLRLAGAVPSPNPSLAHSEHHLDCASHGKRPMAAMANLDEDLALSHDADSVQDLRLAGAVPSPNPSLAHSEHHLDCASHGKRPMAAMANLDEDLALSHDADSVQDLRLAGAVPSPNPSLAHSEHHLDCASHGKRPMAAMANLDEDLALSHDADSVQDLRLAGAVPSPNPSLAHSEHHLDCASHGKRPMAAMANLDEDLALSHDADSVQDLRLAGAVPSPNPSLAHSEHHLDCASHGKRPMAAMANLDEDLALSHDADSVQDLRLAGAVPSPNPSLAHSEHHLDCASHGKRPMAAMANLDEDLALSHDADSVQDLRLAGAVPSPNPSLAHSEHHLDCASHGKRPMAAMANLDEDLALSHDADSVQDLRLAGAVPSPNPSLAHSEHHLDCASHGKRPMAAMANLDEDLALSHDADSVQDLRLAGAVPSPNPSLAHSEHHLDCASHGKRPMAAMANLDEDLALSHDADSVQDLRLAGAVPSPNPSLAHSEHHLDCASHGKRPMAAMANLDEDLALSHDADSVQDLRLAGAVPSPNPSLAHSEHHLDCASHGKRPMAAMANLDEDLALSHDADSVQDLRLAGAVPSPNPSLAHSEHHLDCASHGKRPMAAMANLDEDLALSHDADSVQDLRLAGAVPSPNPSLAHSEHHLDCASHGKRPMAAMANLDEDLALSHDADSVQDLRLAGAVPSPNPSLAHSEHHLDCASHGKRPMAAMANLDEDLALSHDADSVQDLRLAGAVPSPNPSLAHSEHHLDCASHGKRPMAAMANLDEDLALSHDADSVQDLRLAGAVPSPNPSLAHSEHHLDCASHGKRPMAAMANLDEDLALSHDADSVQDLRLAGAVPSPNPSLAHSEHHLDCASHGKRPMAAMANLDEDLALSHDADSVQDLRLAGAVPSPNPSLAHSEHHLDCASHAFEFVDNRFDWASGSGRAFGASTSLYEANPVTGTRAGTPVADVFGVLAREDSALLALADGVNWGDRARLAARCAVRGALDHLNESLFGKGGRAESTLDLFHSLLGAFHAAQQLIIQEEGMLTTLCVAVVAPLKDSDEWVVCSCNVGDSLCFVYNAERGVREVTLGSHDIREMRDMRDAGGALGPVDGVNPELQNLTCSMTVVEEGDLVFITSDGVSDNFDPVVGKFCVTKPSSGPQAPVPQPRHVPGMPAPKAQAAEETPAVTNGSTNGAGAKGQKQPRKAQSVDGSGSQGLPAVEATQRHELMLLRMEDLLRHGVTVGDAAAADAPALANALVNFAQQLTAAKRRTLEDPDLYQGPTKRMDQKQRRRLVRQKIVDMPGKLDHATVVAYVVGQERCVEPSRLPNGHHPEPELADSTPTPPRKESTTPEVTPTLARKELSPSTPSSSEPELSPPAPPDIVPPWRLPTAEATLSAAFAWQPVEESAQLTRTAPDRDAAQTFVSMKDVKSRSPKPSLSSKSPTPKTSPGEDAGGMTGDSDSITLSDASADLAAETDLTVEVSGAEAGLDEEAAAAFISVPTFAALAAEVPMIDEESLSGSSSASSGLAAQAEDIAVKDFEERAAEVGVEPKGEDSDLTTIPEASELTSSLQTSAFLPSLSSETPASTKFRSSGTFVVGKLSSGGRTTPPSSEASFPSCQPLSLVGLGPSTASDGLPSQKTKARHSLISDEPSPTSEPPSPLFERSSAQEPDAQSHESEISVRADLDGSVRGYLDEYQPAAPILKDAAPETVAKLLNSSYVNATAAGKRFSLAEAPCAVQTSRTEVGESKATTPTDGKRTPVALLERLEKSLKRGRKHRRTSPSRHTVAVDASWIQKLRLGRKTSESRDGTPKDTPKGTPTSPRPPPSAPQRSRFSSLLGGKARLPGSPLKTVAAGQDQPPALKTTLSHSNSDHAGFAQRPAQLNFAQLPGSDFRSPDTLL